MVQTALLCREKNADLAIDYLEVATGLDNLNINDNLTYTAMTMLYRVFQKSWAHFDVEYVKNY